MLICGVIFLLSFQLGTADQALIDYLASNIAVEYHVLDNLVSPSTFDGLIVLENSGNQQITSLNWTLYLCSLKLIEPGSVLDGGGVPLGDTNLTVHHLNGNFHKIQPTQNFTGFAVGQRLEIYFNGEVAQVEAAETMPNWYFAHTDAAARVVTSTAGEDLDWVGAFNTPNQWKRNTEDTYDPYTGPVRLSMQNYTDLGYAAALILPTPVEQSLDPDTAVNIGTGDWLVVIGDPTVRPEAEFLAAQLGMVAVDPQYTPASRYITVTIGDVLDGKGQPITTPEAYRIDISTAGNILITGLDRQGAFYGGQSLFSLFEASVEIPSGFVVDYPRFPYRGMHMDVSRNFHSKEDVLRHLDVMSLYKLNKFHFHLTDDEGWRLEVPGLPELTDIGSRRCHDLSGDLCLLPQYGSAPGLTNDGTGYYTVSDYRQILQYAADRHIQVIPEFDMPGHSSAAIQSMNARYRKYIDTNQTAALEFLLVDLNDQSSYISVQNFRNNGINPCVESSYSFIDLLIEEVQAMHMDIQPLTTFHFGGDELAPGAWSESPACAALGENNLMEYFIRRVAELAYDRGLDISAWEDAFMESGGQPMNISSMPNDNKFAYAWNTVFESGDGDKAYVLANHGYKIILSGATHLYFDHPQEPDPYDRGLYWATRITSASKTFGFMPDDYYENMGDDMNGNPLDKDEICSTYGCEPLNPASEANILGMQGQVWSESVRNSAYLDYMVFPRQLALAERAWYKAPWESNMAREAADILKTSDWERFANTLGYKELARLDSRDVQYTVSPHGARIGANNVLEALAEYPGQPVQWSEDQGLTWTDYSEGVTMDTGVVHVIARSNDRSRSSRMVELNVV